MTCGLHTSPTGTQKRSWPSPERAVSQSHFQQGQLGVGGPWGHLMGALVQFDGQAALQASPLGMKSAAQHGCYHLRVRLRPIAVLARPHSRSKSQYNKLIGCKVCNNTYQRQEGTMVCLLRTCLARLAVTHNAVSMQTK